MLDWKGSVANGAGDDHYWEVRSHGIVLAPGEVWVTSPSRIVCLQVGVILRPCVGRIQMFRWCLMSLEY